MSRQTLFIFLALAALITAGLACNLPAKPEPRPLEFTNVSVVPGSSDGKNLTINVRYTSVGPTDIVTISCYYSSNAGPTRIGSAQEAIATIDPEEEFTSFLFSDTSPGKHIVICKSSDGAGVESNYIVIEPAPAEPPKEEQPAQAPQPQKPPASGAQPGTGCKWEVAGEWKIYQVNGYQPVFEITQSGTNLYGTGILSAADAARGMYTGTIGKGTGSISGDTFSFNVTWPPKQDGTLLTGPYSGTISVGRIEEPNGVWYGTGPSICVK